MTTISTTTIGNKTIRIQFSGYSYTATITQSSDINEFGDVLATKTLSTLAGVTRWVNKVMA